MANKKWDHIILHHSATRDNKILCDFDAIARFHTSYRFKGNIISKQEAEKLQAEGKHIILPWRKIGYHYVIEYVNDTLKLREGRTLEESGAHCVGMNSKAIGICIVGNFDIAEPDNEQYEMAALLCEDLIKEFKIPIENIRPHSYYAPWKSCPGHRFNWTKFILRITAKIKNGK